MMVQSEHDSAIHQHPDENEEEQQQLLDRNCINNHGSSSDEESTSIKMIGVEDLPLSITREKQKKALKLTLFTFLVLILLETVVDQVIDGRLSNGKRLNFADVIHNSHQDNTDYDKVTSNHLYSLSEDVKKEYREWHAIVREMSQMQLEPSDWTPEIGIKDWKGHPRDRADRFPSVEERVEYYMGKWYNTSIPLYGEEFAKATFIQRKTTREYGTFSDILVNLYNLDKEKLYECYTQKKELHVMSPYCRDYIDIAILHSEGSANVLHYIGDALPSYIPEQILSYPILSKTRPLCSSLDEVADYRNKLCLTEKRADPIILPLNRKRHFGAAASVPAIDIPWEEKIAKAVWRGMYGKIHDELNDKNTNDIKYNLVSRYVNSSLVDAKFSKHAEDAPPSMAAPYMDVKEQLKYKYIISIEGNDVSSGLKWMLFSNSVVLAPAFTWESWAMEARLEPFVHYLPLRSDMSDVEDMIRWAEAHPDETRMISERSTLYIYDLLFHPDAVLDEVSIMEGIMEKFERNFGSFSERTTMHPLNIQWNEHPSDRASRFPSVEERVKYCMGPFYENNESISMDRERLNQFSDKISVDTPFIASGKKLSYCSTNSNGHAEELQRLCQESLPYFDERNTADLKSSAFGRLSKSNKGKAMKLAPESSWTGDKKGKKEAKRVLLDESVKILYFGETILDDASLPIFSRLRKFENGQSLIWPFGFDENAKFVKSGSLEAADVEFRTKHAKAIWRGGLGTSLSNPLDSDEFQSRLNFVRRSSEFGATMVDAKFILSPNEKAVIEEIDGILIGVLVERDEMTQEDLKLEMLTHRYLVATENESSINNDLLWMLLSQSVVLMPAERRVASWLMEPFLQPYVHFVPIANDYSDIEEKVSWCEENLNEVKKISERATLFVHDMLFDVKSMSDSEEVRFQLMERYLDIFG